MKRSNQLILESIIIAALLFGVLFAGNLSTNSLPQSWIKIRNPDALQPQNNLTSLALYYNNTLSALSEYRFQSVSESLRLFQFLAIPGSVSSTAQTANTEIASMNQSIPAIQYFLNRTEYLYRIGLFTNASLALNSLCSNAQSANSSLNQFDGPTTKSFNQSGVPVSIYQPPIVVLRNEINSFHTDCSSYKSALSGSKQFNLTIASLQTPLPRYGKLWVNTGGLLNLAANLTEGGNGVGGEVVAFFVNGKITIPENYTTSSSGSIAATVTIPYFYQPFVLVSAIVQPGGGIPFLISNTLNMTLLYNQTQIIINDPPQVLPTFAFTVSGTLRDNSTGKILPDAPVRITSFNSSYFTTTNLTGVFSDILIVPANATDGLHYIYANFAPKGAYGPSINFTSIVVYRLPVNLSFQNPSLIIPGIPTSLSGTLSSNNSALSNAQILLSTPWGNYAATTDSNGKFSLLLDVPLTEFGFSSQVMVVAYPAEPYFSSGSTNIVLGLFNVIVIAIIIFACGFGLYLARNLGISLFRAKRQGQIETPDVSASIKTQEIEPDKLEQLILPSAVGFSLTQSPIIASYVTALKLAARKFMMRFQSSMTIRETIDLVSESDKEGQGVTYFSKIALASEDYLYSKKQDLDSIAKVSANVKSLLGKLEDLWGA